MSNPAQKPKDNASSKRFFFLPVQAFTEDLGERISIARRQMRLTQAQLAQKSQTSLATFKRIEQGDMTVSLGTILSVLYCLDELKSCEGILKRNVNQYEKSSKKLPKRIRDSKKDAQGKATSAHRTHTVPAGTTTDNRLHLNGNTNGNGAANGKTNGVANGVTNGVGNALNGSAPGDA